MMNGLTEMAQHYLESLVTLVTLEVNQVAFLCKVNILEIRVFVWTEIFERHLHLFTNLDTKQMLIRIRIQFNKVTV